MALKSKLYMDLHVRRDDGYGLALEEPIRKFVDELMMLASTIGKGEYTGEEFRPNEAVFSFELRNVKAVLLRLRSLVEAIGLLEESFVVVRTNAVSDESDLPVPLKEIGRWSDRLDQLSRSKRKRGRRPKVGDYYALPLPDGRFGHLQYVHRDPESGDFVQVWAVITSGQPAGVDTLARAKPLFPPVITAVSVGIEIGGWVLLGNRPLAEPFRFPQFRGTNSLLFRRHEPGVYADWWLWSGGDTWLPVGSLNDEQRQLEYHTAWQPQKLALRIATGENEYDNFL